MAYIYPLTIDPLNLTGKHNDDVVEAIASKKKRASILIDKHHIVLTSKQVQLLVFTIDFYIESCKDMLDFDVTVFHKCCIEECISLCSHLRDVLLKSMQEE